MTSGTASARLEAWGGAAGRQLAGVLHARPWHAAWGITAVLLAGWVLWESVRPLEARGVQELVAQRARPPSLPQAPAIAPESLNALQQRVLFKGRNQTAGNASVQATAQELQKKLHLRGISRHGETRVAYIEVKGEPVKRVAAGDKIAEFTVVRVDSGGVRLQLAGEQVVLGF